jgi:hypothetical protein
VRRSGPRDGTVELDRAASDRCGLRRNCAVFVYRCGVSEVSVVGCDVRWVVPNFLKDSVIGLLDPRDIGIATFQNVRNHLPSDSITSLSTLLLYLHHYATPVPSSLRYPCTLITMLPLYPHHYATPVPSSLRYPCTLITTLLLYPHHYAATVPSSLHCPCTLITTLPLYPHHYATPVSSSLCYPCTLITAATVPSSLCYPCTLITTLPLYPHHYATALYDLPCS